MGKPIKIQSSPHHNTTTSQIGLGLKQLYEEGKRQNKKKIHFIFPNILTGKEQDEANLQFLHLSSKNIHLHQMVASIANSCTLIK